MDVYTLALINCRVLTENCYRLIKRQNDVKYDVSQVATKKKMFCILSFYTNK